mmetsp:Transcript_73596/g.137532  ORF Transcript_73596/g.137532 Transcript_73596/m.137532 type:complete len:271 (-) Transcript_73596:136-948(-)
MWWLLSSVALAFAGSRALKALGPYIGDDASKRVALGHAFTVASGAVFLLPIDLIGLGFVKRIAYTACLWSAVITCGYTVKANFGFPKVPQGMSMTNFSAIKQAATTVLQPWLQEVMIKGVDFHFIFFALIFIAAQPSPLAVGILCRRSLWSVCAYCSKNTPTLRLWLKFKPVWDGKLKPREAEIVQYSALAEVGLGIWLVVSILLPMRQILVTVLYWNYLKTRFQMPRSHDQHLKAWQTLGEKVEPAFKALPILRKPVDMAKGWFQPQRA